MIKLNIGTFQWFNVQILCLPRIETRFQRPWNCYPTPFFWWEKGRNYYVKTFRHVLTSIDCRTAELPNAFNRKIKKSAPFIFVQWSNSMCQTIILGVTRKRLPKDPWKRMKPDTHESSTMTEQMSIEIYYCFFFSGGWKIMFGATMPQNDSLNPSISLIRFNISMRIRYETIMEVLTNKIILFSWNVTCHK